MYIKFCCRYAWDQKDKISDDLSPEHKLPVELEGAKDKQTGGKTHLYRAACIFLTVLCLVLLLSIVILYVQICPGRMATAEEDTVFEVSPTCSPEACQVYFPNTVSQRYRCEHCPDGWVKTGQWCFLFSTFRLSWDESQSHCSAKGGSLVVISSEEVQQWLTNMGKLFFWIGLKRNRETWTWIGNTELKESYWADLPLNQDCVILRGGASVGKNWITGSCQSYLYFICQLQL